MMHLLFKIQYSIGKCWWEGHSVDSAATTNYYNSSLPWESACGKAILEIAVPTKYNKETIEKAMGK